MFTHVDKEGCIRLERRKLLSQRAHSNPILQYMDHSCGIKRVQPKEVGQPCLNENVPAFHVAEFLNQLVHSEFPTNGRQNLKNTK